MLGPVSEAAALLMTGRPHTPEWGGHGPAVSAPLALAAGLT